MVYRFRVTFEEYDDVIRDIEVKALQSFEDLHLAILASIGFDTKHDASFYHANEQWKRGQEFSTRPGTGVKAMKGTRLTDSINDPHQRFGYMIHSHPAWEFYVELFKISKDEDKVYPSCVKSTGVAPKQYGTSVLGQEKQDLDFLNESAYSAEEEEGGPDLEDGPPKMSDDDSVLDPIESGEDADTNFDSFEDRDPIND